MLDARDLPDRIGGECDAMPNAAAAFDDGLTLAGERVAHRDDRL